MYSVIFIGFDIADEHGSLIRAHVSMVLASMDLPAKAITVNMKQYNGKASCTYCLDPGETMAGNRLHRFWPHTATQVFRTEESFMQSAMTAIQRNTAVCIPMQ